MNIVNRLKRSNGARFGICLAVAMVGSRVAKAEVPLLEKDGWTFSFDGRVDSFLSYGYGDDFPNPTPEPTGGTRPAFTANHAVMGKNSLGPGNGRQDIGWPSAYQEDANGKYQGYRVRSGMYPNILGFAITRQVSETTTIRGYISIWSTVESLGRDKWAPMTAEAREGYFTAKGNWGSATVGRTLAMLGRMSYEIDTAYGHGYGVGLPCTDALGPACGHIGTGVLFPGYSAGISYATPSAGGLQLALGLYDPVEIVPFGSSPADWTRASFARPEGAITFGTPLGRKGRLGLAVEGLYQPLSRTTTDAATMLPKTVSTAIWGVSGGGRLEVGPLRLGVSGFMGKGIGLGYALGSSVAAADNDTAHAPCLGGDHATGAPCVTGNTYELRTFTGGYVQGALVFGAMQVSLGYGLALVNQVDADKFNYNLSVIHYQRGLSGGVFYAVSDSVVLGLDAFLFNAGWYGAPIFYADTDPTTMQTGPTSPTGAHVPGETQQLVFVNLGVTYHW